MAVVNVELSEYDALRESLKDYKERVTKLDTELSGLKKGENVVVTTKYCVRKVESIKKLVENSIETLKGYSIKIPRSSARELEQDEFFIADLIGMEVFLENGEAFGTLTDVIQTGANDVYQVQSGKYGEVLIPAIHDCILDVDVKSGRMTVHLLDGMLE